MGGRSLRIVLTLAANDFRLTVKERSSLLWMVLMPILFMFAFGSFGAGGGRGRPRATLTVENGDRGFVGERLVRAIDDPHIAIVDSLPPGADPVRTLVVPAGFTDDLLSRRGGRVELRKEPGANAEASGAASVAIVKGQIRLGAGLLRIEAAQAALGRESFRVEGDSVRGSLAAAIAAGDADDDALARRLDTLLAEERIVAVAAEDAGRRPVPRGYQSSVPGMLVMFVLMSMVFGGTAIAAERSGGILRRIGTTPAGRFELVAGKLLGRVYVAFAQAALLLAAGRFLFGVSLGGSPAALFALMLAFACCTGAFSLLFGSLFTDPDQVSGFAILTTLALSALGGCWWPLEIVSRPFRIVALLLPTGWAISGLHRIVSFGYGLSAVTMHIAVLLAFGALFLLIAVRRLRWTDGA